MRGQDLDSFDRADSKSLDDVAAADSPTDAPARQRRRGNAAQVCLCTGRPFRSINQLDYAPDSLLVQ